MRTYHLSKWIRPCLVSREMRGGLHRVRERGMCENGTAFLRGATHQPEDEILRNWLAARTIYFPSVKVALPLLTLKTAPQYFITLLRVQPETGNKKRA